MLKKSLRFFVMGAILINLPACSSNHFISLPQLKPPKVDQNQVVRAPVTKVIDGDTIKVMLNAQETTIRFLLIDTPETHHPKLGVQPFGPEASAEVHRLLDHQEVILEFPENRDKDHYGRTLAYVFTTRESVEMDLLEKGLARIAYVNPSNTRYLKNYQEAEVQAKNKHIRIWKFPGYVQSNGFHPEVLSK